MEKLEPEQKPQELKLDGALWLFLSNDEQHDLKKGNYYEADHHQCSAKPENQRKIG